MMPDALWTDWQLDAAAAFQAVAQHAANVGNWGAVEWVVALLTAGATLVKILKHLPLPPLIQAGVAALDQWLPQLTGRRARQIEKQRDRALQTAQGAVASIDQGLAWLRGVDPDLADAVVLRLKSAQDQLGAREEIRALLHALRAAQPNVEAPAA